MGIAKIVGIVLVIYLLAGFVVAYMLATGMIAIYWNVIVEYIAVVFTPVIYVLDITAPIIGLPPTQTFFGG